MILHDTFNPKLKPYIEKFNLFVLSKEKSEWDRIKNEPIEFLHEHRYEVAHLYDIFVEWSKAQIEHHCNCGEARMFNIQGP